MATVKYSLVQRPDWTSFKFQDNTGQQPDIDTGYTAGDDLTNYTSTLKWIDEDGETVYSFSPEVEGSGRNQLFDFPNNVAAEDQCYTVVYEVFDSTGESVGSYTLGSIVDKDFMEGLGCLLNEAVLPFPNIKSPLLHYREFHASRQAAVAQIRLGNYPVACALFNNAWARLKKMV